MGRNAFRCPTDVLSSQASNTHARTHARTHPSKHVLFFSRRHRFTVAGSAFRTKARAPLSCRLHDTASSTHPTTHFSSFVISHAMRGCCVHPTWMHRRLAHANLAAPVLTPVCFSTLIPPHPPYSSHPSIPFVNTHTHTLVPGAIATASCVAESE
jgi:hypothetical protein